MYYKLCCVNCENYLRQKNNLCLLIFQYIFVAVWMVVNCLVESRNVVTKHLLREVCVICFHKRWLLYYNSPDMHTHPEQYDLYWHQSWHRRPFVRDYSGEPVPET